MKDMGASKETGAIALLLDFEISLVTYISSLVFICKDFEKKKKKVKFFLPK